MISFDLGSLAAAQKMVQGVKIFTLAESLGGVESLISPPRGDDPRHRPRERIATPLGITEGLVRISVGIEDLEDLLGDLEGALGGL